MDLYRVCGHCNKLVSEKTYKEHRRLFFHDQGWIKESAGIGDEGSRRSSPLCMSDPSEMQSCSSHHLHHDMDNSNLEELGSADEIHEESFHFDEGN
jgi:hypothetical protein